MAESTLQLVHVGTNPPQLVIDLDIIALITVSHDCKKVVVIINCTKKGEQILEHHVSKTNVFFMETLQYHLRS